MACIAGVIAGFTLVLLGGHALGAPAGAGYHLLKQVPLPAAPGGGEYFDYITVDGPSRRVYVSHGTEVVVLDADKLNGVGTIGGLKRCHGVALVNWERVLLLTVISKR